METSAVPADGLDDTRDGIRDPTGYRWFGPREACGLTYLNLFTQVGILATF